MILLIRVKGVEEGVILWFIRAQQMGRIGQARKLSDEMP